MIREREIEAFLRKMVTKQGGLCLKFVSPGWEGAPDRIILFPGGKIFFVEVKRPGERPRPLQLKRHEELRKLGFSVYVIDGKEQVRDLIQQNGTGDLQQNGSDEPVT